MWSKKQPLYSLARRFLSVRARGRLKRLTRWPPVGLVDMGSLGRLTPIGTDVGWDRGQPIDRYYIEHFLDTHAADVKGRVLEIGDDRYTRRFGGVQVTRGDVLHVQENHPGATMIGDLTRTEEMPENAFDCFIVTQTLHSIYNVTAAIRSIHRVLKPGGVVLATDPGVTRISRYDMDRWGQYWGFTTKSSRLLFGSAFPDTHIGVRSYGNVLAAIAFVHGLASQDLAPEALDHFDPDHQFLIATRAVKPG